MKFSFGMFALVANSIGLVSSLICLSLFLFIGFKNRKYVNRVTLQLQAALSLVDLFLHLLVFTSSVKHEGMVCSILGLVASILNSTYLCIVLAITLNLHLNILYTERFNKKYLRYFWVAIIILPLIYNLPLYAYGMFGEDSYGVCLISESVPHRRLLIALTVLVPMLIIFIYCVVISVLIVNKTNRDDNLLNKMLEAHNVTDEESRLYLKKLLNSWILRIVLYPVAFCLIQSGFLVDTILQILFNHYSTFALYWNSTGTFLSGLINLIVFTFDPHFQSSIRSILNKRQDHLSPLDDDLKDPTELNYQPDGSHPLSREDSSQTQTGSGRRYREDPRETDRLLQKVTTNF